MNKLVQQLGLILLICLGVRIGAELLRPAWPLLLTIAMVVGLVWLVRRLTLRGYR
jgi:hypothetical protein